MTLGLASVIGSLLVPEAKGPADEAATAILLLGGGYLALKGAFQQSAEAIGTMAYIKSRDR